MRKLPLIYRTLKDIPASQLIDRFSFEAKYRIISKLKPEQREKLLLNKLSTAELRADYLSKLFVREKEVQEYNGNYSFEFLNKEEVFDKKILWNSSKYSRLWQFHLHYFDYFCEDLEKVYQYELDTSEFINKANNILNDWIDNNHFFSFDGWHPYTTSLRIVNWVYSFIAFPSLVNQKSKDSLWKQLVYLSKNKETFAGGNHLLENLRALIIAGLYFDSEKADRIVKNALKDLEKELNIQVLADGGHYEYSSSYHLLMTKLLAEIIIALKSANWQVPASLEEKLSIMLEYSQNIRLLDGSYPLWNDASFDSAPSLDTVLWFGSSLLQKTIKTNISKQTKPLLAKLLESINRSKAIIQKEAKAELTKLETSGYYLLKSGNLELSFDAAPPCPKELPGHAHADCLSFNLYKDGKALIIETGTSQYGSGKIRDYERSTAAHNTITFNNQNQSEVWAGFRVGRKAQPQFVESGQTNGITWVSASHNGYKLINANHHRWLGIFEQTIIILDKLSAKQETTFSSNLHLAPEEIVKTSQGSSSLSPSNLQIHILSNLKNINIKIKDKQSSNSYYAPIMGKRIPRAKLNISGAIKGSKIVCTILHFGSLKPLFEANKQQVSLQILDKSLKWIITNKGLRLK